jgi:hypothetical protein
MWINTETIFVNDKLNINFVKMKSQNIVIPITGTLSILFLANYPSFSSGFAFTLALYRPPGYGSAFECGASWPSNAHCGSGSVILI